MMSVPHETAWKLLWDLTWLARSSKIDIRVGIFNESKPKRKNKRLKIKTTNYSIYHVVGKDALKDAKRGCVHSPACPHCGHQSLKQDSLLCYNTVNLETNAPRRTIYCYFYWLCECVLNWSTPPTQRSFSGLSFLEASCFIFSHFSFLSPPFPVRSLCFCISPTRSQHFVSLSQRYQRVCNVKSASIHLRSPSLFMYMLSDPVAIA